MSTTSQTPFHHHSMFAKIALIFTLIASLLSVTQSRPMMLPVEMKDGGGCAGAECARGCCTNMACCKAVEESKAPTAPISVAQTAHVQLATIGLRAYTFVFHPPAPRHPFVMRDEARTAHTLSPLAVSCIRLI